MSHVPIIMSGTITILQRLSYLRQRADYNWLPVNARNAAVIKAATMAALEPLMMAAIKAAITGCHNGCYNRLS